jgi:hypothetical protein
VKRISLLLVVIGLAVSMGAPSSNAQSQINIALLDSANTRAFFNAHYPACDPLKGSFYLGADEYQRYFRGWEWVLMKLGLPYEIIHDDDVTADGLSQVKLLILSNNALLSDDQTKAVHQWVIRGGHLLATFGTGYKDLVTDPRQIDGWKQQKGGTLGLHELWHDPVGKLFSSYWVDSGVDAKITRYSGPTALLAHSLKGDVLPYGAEANLLIQRPLNYPDALGFLVIDNPNWKSTTPAIISTRQAKGLVVYFAFAPEYIVYKELEMPGNTLGSLGPGWPPCYDGQNWAGRSTELLKLMIGTLDYLLSN